MAEKRFIIQNRQHLLPYGSPQEIDSAVTQVHDTLWDNGGYITQCEFGPGNRPENVRRVYKTWERLTRNSTKIKEAPPS